jgi:hypothetical protein
MNIKELGHEYELAPAVMEAVSLTKDLTGKEIDFQLSVKLNTDGITKIARERMPQHIIKIRENSPARINHVIVHECGHILRLMKADPVDRVVPSSNARTTGIALDAMKNELLAIPENVRREAFELWSSGIINQLVNLPVDVRIERWIHLAYPPFRDIQNKSIAFDVKNCVENLSATVRQNTIESIFNKSNAMVYAYLRSISEITGENYSSAFQSYPDIKKTGRKLFAYLESEDGGFQQDIDTINAWAEILKINDWFTWIGFEDVPESYFEG